MRGLVNRQSRLDSRRSCRSQIRSGVAAIELAVCLPMLCLVVFGSIQACCLIYLKHAVAAAAYEGTIELIRPNSSNDSVINRIEHVLTAYEVESYEVGFVPRGTNISILSTGTPIEIRVRADVESNLPLSGWFPSPPVVEHTVVGPR